MTDDAYQALESQANACELDPADVTDPIDPTEDEDDPE